ncbi:hypothetical protein LINGRAHAP2_LOCUS2090 [Linum grandiflorum]
MIEVLLLEHLQLIWGPALLLDQRCLGLSEVYSLFGTWRFVILGSIQSLRRRFRFFPTLQILTINTRSLLCNFMTFAAVLSFGG